MAEAFIVRRGGGGGSGGTLVVTSSGAGTVTVSNSALGKSYSKSVTAGGSVTFKGLKTGEWTVTLSNGAQTTTRSVTINADYSVSVAYFSATISVTYPANSTCVVTNSSGQTVASDTNTGSSTKTWTATVNATGTYTITATATDGSGKTKSTTVSITADGQSESVTLSYELVLFDNGTYAEETGGWTGSGSGGSSSGGVESNKLYACGYYGSSAHDGYGYFYTVNKVDLTSYGTLHFIVDSTTGNFGKSVGYGSKQTTQNGKTSAPIETTEQTELTIDISSVNGEFYINGISVGAGVSNYLYVSKVWLD